jgi:predicted XRE-type DNA-binding protein
MKRQLEWIEQIHALMDEGIQQREIGERLGIAQQRVSQLYRQALELYPLKNVDHRRELALMQIDEAVDATMDVLRADHPFVSEGRVVFPVVGWEIGDDGKKRPVYGETPLQDAKPVLQAATTLATLLKRTMDQIGGDAPKRLETVNAHVSAQDLRVSALLGDLAAVNSGKVEAIAARVEARRASAPGAGMPVPGLSEAAGRPQTARERRSAGFGASPARVASWDPEAAFVASRT